MAKAVGVDIGSSAVKVAVVEGSPKGARLLRFAEVPYALGENAVLTPAAVLAALKKALSDARAPRNSASVALPAEQLVVREITVPFVQDEQIKKVAKFEFEPHLHNASIEDVVIDYVKTGPARQGTRLLVFCASKSMLRSRLEQLAAAGVDPLHLDVDVASLFNVARAAGAFAEHPNCLVIDVGARTTKALWIRDGELKVARSMRLGSAAARRRLESALDGDREAAERAHALEAGAETLAEPPGPTTLDIVQSVEDIERAVARGQEDDFLSRMLRETTRTMPAMAAEEGITRVYLTGGGARRARARERIAEHFGVETQDLPVLAALDHRLPPSEADAVGASAAVAIGTALKVLGTDAAEVDLRREEFRFSRTFDQVKVALACAVTLVFFATFVVWLTYYMQSQSVDRQLAELRDTYDAEIAEDLVVEYEEKVPDPRLDRSRSDDPLLHFRGAQNRVKTIRSHLKEQLGLSTEVPPIRSAMETWAAVMKGIAEVRPKIKYLAIKDENYAQEDARLSVVVGALDDVDTLVLALRKQDQIFSSVEFASPRPTKDGRYESEIRLELREKTFAEPVAADAARSGEVRTASGEAGR